MVGLEMGGKSMMWIDGRLTAPSAHSHPTVGRPSLSRFGSTSYNQNNGSDQATGSQLSWPKHANQTNVPPDSSSIIITASTS